MRFNFPHPDWRNVRRRLCAGVTLLAYLAAAIGFPLPNATANACGQQVCGCATAQTCQTGGCCCSHPQPAEFDESDVPSCCGKKNAAVKPSCCTQNVTKPKPVQWVVGIAAQKCQGGAAQWMSAQAALPGPTPIDWQPSWPFCHDVPVVREVRWFLSGDLSDPPPRLGVR